MVYIQHRLDEHAQRHVDQAQFIHRKLFGHDVKESVGQRHIVATVLAVSCEIFWCEVHTPLVDSSNHLVTLNTHAVALGQRLERTSRINTMKSTSDTQRVEIHSRLDAEYPIQNRAVEQRVMCKHHGVAPVELG